MAKILIKNGRVFDGESFFFADVLTNGNKIEKIEKGICDKANFVFDAEGKTVMPGLVDMHVHMLLHPTDQYGIQTEMSCFPFGVTAAADAGRTRGDRAIFDSFAVKNLVFVSAHIKENRIDFENLCAAIDRFGDKVVGLKIYFDSTLSDARDITPLAELCDFAKSRKLPVMVHCSNSPTPMADILATLNPGDILTHAFHGKINTAADDGFESMKAAKARGIIIDGGFAGNNHANFAVLKGAIESGVLPNSISTDITKFSAYTRGGRYGMTMCMSIAKHLGMDEIDIFKAVTSSPAKALGKGDEWGNLKVGGTADIAVIDYTDEGYSLTDEDGNHIESKSGYRCILTVADGQTVYRH